MSEYTVVVCQPPNVDLVCFAEWTRGLAVSDLVASNLFRPQSGSAAHDKHAVHTYVVNQFRLYILLERYLQRPTCDDGRVNIFEEQMLIPLSPAAREKLLELYYDFDGPVIREILVRRMRMRRDLEDIAEELRVSGHSCRRQFNNLKNIAKLVEQLETIGVVDAIQSHFLLPSSLAVKYARIIFLFSNRIEVFKHRKRLGSLTFEELCSCAAVLMDNWTVPPTQFGRTSAKADLDGTFLRDVSDLKVLILNTGDTLDELREQLRLYFHTKHPQLVTKGKGNVRNFVRAILTIGAGVRLEKEFRDILVDLDEKLVEPARKVNWTARDMDALLDGLLYAFPRLKSVETTHSERLVPTLERLIAPIRSICSILFKY